MDIEELRLAYDLNKDSIVLDIGSYIGQFSRKIYDRHKCRVFAFEPIQEYFKNSQNGFLKGLPVKVFNYGIGPENLTTTIHKSGDTSSMLSHEGEMEVITVRTMEGVMGNIGIDNADLVKINIEGIEYSLLDKWYQSGLLARFKNLQIQFHKIPGWETLVTKARQQLAGMHSITYNLEMVWENWQRK